MYAHNSIVWLHKYPIKVLNDFNKVVPNISCKDKHLSLIYRGMWDTMYDFVRMCITTFSESFETFLSTLTHQKEVSLQDFWIFYVA
jgi:hypothetical protein